MKVKQLPLTRMEIGYHSLGSKVIWCNLVVSSSFFEISMIFILSILLILSKFYLLNLLCGFVALIYVTRHYKDEMRF